MGTSTDGITFFGACWAEDDEPYWPWAFRLVDGEHEPVDDENEEEPATWLARATGFGLSKPEWPGENGTEAQVTVWYAKLTAWREAQAAHLEAVGLGGLSFGAHCSDPCVMQYVAITATEVKASRGYPERCEQAPEDPVWRNTLRRLAEVTGVDIDDDEIGWWLTSWWG